MCGSLRLEGQIDKKRLYPGDVIEFNNVKAIWDGHARSETLEEKWTPYGWKKVLIPIKEFSERDTANKTYEHKYFTPPKGTKVVGIYKQGKVRIVTREANQKEKKIHHRFPLTEK